MTNKVWYELVDTKHGEIYLSKYIARQRSLKKVFQIMTLIVSLSGILGWKYFEDYVWIVFILIGIIQLLLLIENKLIRSDEEIEEISELRMMYTRYFNKIEKLWVRFQYDTVSEEKLIDKFFNFRESDWESIEKLDCKLNIKQYNKLIKQTEIETVNYLNKYHIND